MKTIKNITETIFNDILNNKLYHQFAFLTLDSTVDPVVPAYVHHYLKIIKDNEDNLFLLSLLEKLIVQLRCKEFIDGNIKFSKVGDYIYARAPFFKNKGNKDIRVVIGRTTEYDIPIEDMVHNPRASTEAKNKLIEAMDKEIKSSVDEINKKLKIEKISSL